MTAKPSTGELADELADYKNLCGCTEDDRAYDGCTERVCIAQRNAIEAALRSSPAGTDAVREAHKVMTAEEYAVMPIVGWHEVCRDVDGFGGVGVRFLGVAGTDVREALEKIRRIPAMPFPDPSAHSWLAWGQAVFRAYNEIQWIACVALSDIALASPPAGMPEPPKVNFDCFWSRCSDSKRCREYGSCVALAQRKAVAAGDFPSKPSVPGVAREKIAVEALREILKDGTIWRAQRIAGEALDALALIEQPGEKS